MPLINIASQQHLQISSITPISMSTLNERLLIGQNPDSMSIFLLLYTCADLL